MLFVRALIPRIANAPGLRRRAPIARSEVRARQNLRRIRAVPVLRTLARTRTAQPPRSRVRPGRTNHGLLHAARAVPPCRALPNHILHSPVHYSTRVPIPRQRPRPIPIVLHPNHSNIPPHSMHGHVTHRGPHPEQHKDAPVHTRPVTHPNALLPRPTSLNSSKTRHISQPTKNHILFQQKPI